MVDEDEPSLILSATSPDGEEGLPGEVKVQVTYTLTNDNCIKIHYTGETDEDTVLNMTNHLYFNLNGHSSGSIDKHSLWIDSDFYTPNTDECIPTGEILSVKNTPFDFSTDELLGERFESNHEQIRKFGGFDHNFALNGSGYRRVARVEGDKTGIVMEVYADTTGIQLYSGNMIQEGRVCKAHYPLEFYCAYFNTYLDKFDADLLIDNSNSLHQQISETKYSLKNADISNLIMMEVCQEMYDKGYKFTTDIIDKKSFDGFCIENGNLKPKLK